MHTSASLRWLEAAVFVPMVLRLAALDALSVVGLQLCTAVQAPGVAWRPSLRNIALFCVLGGFAGWGVAYVAVVHLHLWAAVDLFQMLQLPLTGLASVAVARLVSGIGHSGRRRFS